MWNLKLWGTSVALSVALAGSVSVAGAGVAGAATTVTRPASHSSAAASQRACTRLRRDEALVLKDHGMYARTTAKFARYEAKAAENGNKRMAAYWKKVVSHRDALAAVMATRQSARRSAAGHRNVRVARTC